MMLSAEKSECLDVKMYMWMSKSTSDGLTRSGTGCFIARIHMTTLSIKGLNKVKTTVHHNSLSLDCFEEDMN